MNVADRATAPNTWTDWLAIGLKIDVRILPWVGKVRIRHSHLPKTVATKEAATAYIAISRPKEVYRCIERIIRRHMRAVAEILDTTRHQTAGACVVYQHRSFPGGECQRIFVFAFHPSAGSCGNAWQGAALTPVRRWAPR